MDALVNIAGLLFAGFAILIGIASVISLSILFKHAEKRAVASEVALIYLALYFFLLLGGFSSAGLI